MGQRGTVPLLAGLLSLAGACATGWEIDSSIEQIDEPGGSGGTGGAGGEGAHGTTTTTSTTSTAGTGGEGGGGGGGGNAPACDFDAPNTCPSAEQLPSVSGDEGGTAQGQGKTSKWLAVHITEDDSSIFPTDLSYTVTLTSPAGMDYDLFVRQGPEDGSPDCNAAEKKGQPSGSSETVHAGWNDDQGLGGEDDSLWLCIEVRWISGDDCNATWTLTVQGAT